MKASFVRGVTPLKSMNIGKINNIKEWLNEKELEEETDYFIFDDLTIRIKNLSLDALLPLPDYIKFKTATIYDCTFCELTSLVGVVPEIVEHNFCCNNNNLTALDSLPKFIGRNFFCSINKLTSLNGSPKTVNGNFDCDYNQLTTLEGGPEFVNGSFNCSQNPLKNLDGSPKEVIGDFILIDTIHRFTEKEIRSYSKIYGNIILTEKDFYNKRSRITELRNHIKW